MSAKMFVVVVALTFLAVSVQGLPESQKHLSSSEKVLENAPHPGPAEKFIIPASQQSGELKFKSEYSCKEDKHGEDYIPVGLHVETDAEEGFAEIVIRNSLDLVDIYRQKGGAKDVVVKLSVSCAPPLRAHFNENNRGGHGNRLYPVPDDDDE